MCFDTAKLGGVVLLIFPLGCGMPFEGMEGAGGEAAATSGAGATGSGSPTGGGSNPTSGGAPGAGGSGGTTSGTGGAGGQGTGAGGQGGAGCADGQTNIEGACYVYVTTEVDWASALNNCIVSGGYLAALGSTAEVDSLLTSGFIPADNSVGPWGITWIGGNDIDADNGFEWSNADPWVFTHYQFPWKQPSEPNNFSGPERCVDFYAYPGAGGTGLNDELCTRLRPYLCEFDPQ